MKHKLDFFKGFEWIIEAIGWIRIFLSPFLIGCAIAYFIYATFTSDFGLVAASFILVVFIGIGIGFATKIWRKTGTITFLSRLESTTDLDEKSKSK